MLIRHILDDGSLVYCIIDKGHDGALHATVTMAEELLDHHAPFASVEAAKGWLAGKVPAHKDCTAFRCPRFQMLPPPLP